eukprot:gene14831-31496_t
MSTFYADLISSLHTLPSNLKAFNFRMNVDKTEIYSMSRTTAKT